MWRYPLFHQDIWQRECRRKEWKSIKSWQLSRCRLDCRKRLALICWMLNAGGIPESVWGGTEVSLLMYIGIIFCLGMNDATPRVFYSGLHIWEGVTMNAISIWFNRIVYIFFLTYGIMSDKTRAKPGKKADFIKKTYLFMLVSSSSHKNFDPRKEINECASNKTAPLMFHFFTDRCH